MLSPHLRTIAPRFRHVFRGTGPDGAEEWRVEVPDERWGSVEIGGRLHRRQGARDLVILVHGLGGCSASHYMLPAAEAVVEAGADCLRLDLRGSDLRGEDFYHAGLSRDLGVAATSPQLATYERLYLLGFSLGGHLALRWAVDDPDPRLRRVAAICSPLELAPAQREFDLPSRWLYRQYVLGRLRRIYEPVARRRELATSLEAVRAARTIREWDRLTVVPRFGFRDVDDYYEAASVGPRLADLAAPALLVAAVGDPMVPPAAIEPALNGSTDRLQVRWVEEAGHVGFPRGLDLGFPGAPGLERQVVAWLLEES